MMASIAPCTVFAENNTVVFNPASFNRSPAVDYTKTVVAAELPGQHQGVITSQMNQRYLSLRGNSPGRIYLSADGKFGMDLDANANLAESIAQSQCVNSTGFNPAYPCFRYAVDATIEMTPSILGGMRSSPLLHCRAIPRLNCAAHRQMGCTAGSFYVTYTGGLSLENCP